MRFYDKLIEQVKEANTFGLISELLEWDKDVMMPKKQLFFRQIELSTLAAARHKIVTSKSYEENIKGAESEDLNEDEEANLREIKWDFERQKKIPEELVKRIAHESAKSHDVWVEKRSKDDFEGYKEQFQKLIDLANEYAKAIAPEKKTYDVLLEDFEKSLSQEEIKEMFDKVKEAIIPMLREDTRQEFQDVKKETQIEFLNEMLKHINYDFEMGRLDESVHPFSAYHGRITTRFTEGWTEAIFSTLHEAGHAMYEINLPKEYYGTPRGNFCSFSVHESQSRFLENMIGRSKEFWIPLFDKLKQKYNLDITLDEFHKFINTTKPGFIRVQADELTYTLHIIIRFEIEQELFGGELKLEDAQKAWNEKTKKYLGLDVDKASHGILQDVHYGSGYFGYFPTYALGNMVAAQLYEAMKEDFPVLEDVSKGEFKRIQNWMKEKVHLQGRKYNTKELVKFATGKEFGPDAYIRYLKSKFEK